MKPTKNRIFCPCSQRPKMVFATKKEAISFLKFNANDIKERTGIKPVRAYYCTACGAWHITSKPQSSDQYDLIRRFGETDGNKIFEKVKAIKGRRVSIKEGLYRELRQLRHALKFPVVDTNRCRVMIDELLDHFETVMRIQLEEPNVIKKLFNKFCDLCNVYIDKTQPQAISA